METKFTIKEQEAIAKKKYGKTTLNLVILERALGEKDLFDLLEVYNKACKVRGSGSSQFNTVSHKDVYMLYKGGKSHEDLVKLFGVPKSRIHESLFLGAEQFLRDNS